ncbi:hypothetical protein JCM1840_002090 [Sporobolomyces johnsonii]
MADEHATYNFDLEAYCIVCDRAIDPNRPLPPPSPPPSAFSSAATPAPPPPSNASSSARSTTSGPSAPKLKRTSSAHSTTSAGAGGASSKGASGTALKRNRSTGRLHHAAGHRKSHSHTNLHGLAPMTTAVPPEGKSKKAAAAVEREKGSKPDKGDAAVDKDDRVQACEPASALYCSEECRRIDEARNQLALSHLGSSNSSSMPYFASASAPPTPDHAGPSFPSMARRRSSGVSSGASASLAISSAGERGLSPILSAAPTSNNVNQHAESPSFPFPAVSASPAASPTLGPSAPPMPSRLSSSSLASHSISHSHSQSMSQTLSQQGAPPPLLNFSSRRQSRSAHSSGAYSYRPSLMERVPSADGVAPSTSVPLYAGGGLMTRGARSMSTNSSGSGSGFFARTRSTDGIAGMGSAEMGDDRERDGRHPTVHRPPSALSSLRSMTPISSTPSISPTRPRPPIALARHSDHVSSSLRESSSLSRPSSRNVSHDPPPPIVGSAPASRARGLSFGEPTTELLYPVPTSRPPPSHHRSSSSASLALLGSSLSKAQERGGSWAGPTRSESTAGLSGLVALGAMASPATSSTTPLPPSSSSTASTLIPAPSTSYRDRGAASSPSSTSSFAHSHSSARTSSSRRSTAASSDHHPPFAALSSSVGVGESLVRTRSGSSTRVKHGLTMTPSASHLPSATTTTSELSSSPNPHSTAAPPNPNPTATAPATNPTRTWSWSALHVPTYPALDVSEFRAQKDREKKQQQQQLLEKRERDGDGDADRDSRRSGEEEGDGAMLMLPPPVPPRAQRKRLFYFSDAGDAE